MSDIKNIFLEACRLEETSHMPVWYMRQAGRSLPEYRELKSRYDFLTLATTPELIREVTLQPVERLGVDAAIIFSDIVLPLRGAGFDLQIREGVGPVIDNPITAISDIENLSRIKPEIDCAYMGQAIKLMRLELNGKVPLIGFAGAPFTLASYLLEGRPSKSFSKVRALMHGDKTSYHALMKWLVKFTAVYLNYQISCGAQAVQVFDSWAGWLCAADYKQYVWPHMRELFGQVSSQVPRIHFGTGTAQFLDAFAEVDCEVVGIDWRVSLKAARECIGPGKALQGNLDPSILLVDDFDVISRKVDEIFEKIGDRRGFIFNLGHGILPETPVENLLKLTQYIHDK